jgi:hypothetical protein
MAGGLMKSHDLAKILLENPNLPIATFANNHDYASGSTKWDDLKIGFFKHYSGKHIIVGNISKKNINGPNGYITEMIHGDVPDEWPSRNLSKW